ncbi:molybdopterin molybdotransferase MoeA [Streptomyces longispororuber]|uniref:molybdopterin molybdotransferase MoeA n=1 Tax=Streptomyces longispororuber TaxID=68230 RepID=UPI00210BC82B|nr:molybdopterin molybdotransferase MoeA [Streptomyces longispororuber]MCQ4209239.1 molybdopterin molybdotransferase MoeA [Streptomyces longispororuber]
MSGGNGRAAQADPLDGDVDEALALANDNRGRGPAAAGAPAPGRQAQDSADRVHETPGRGPVPGAQAAAGADRPADRHRATPWPEARRIAARAGRHAAEHRARTAPAPEPAETQLPLPDGLFTASDGGAAAASDAPRTPRGATRLPLDRALGLILAAPLTALTDLPSFDTSAMDGWVVAGPGPWAVRDEGILAGHGRPAPLADGEAAAIATGARIPAETTAVIRSEHGHLDGKGQLHPLRDVAHGQDIRPRGQECRSGDLLLPAGALVTPAVLGLAAAAGYDELVVVPRPRAEVLVLGDELLTSGLPREGLIRDALGPMLPHWLRALGVEVIAVRRLGDDAKALLKAVRGSKADLVVTTGGTASGPVDHVHPTLRALDAELLVDGVKVRPGHPMLLARLTGGRHLVGLPGNPLAAVSGLLTLAEPLLRELSGPAQYGSAPSTSAGSGFAQDAGAPLHSPVHGHPHDTRLVPVVLRQDDGSGHDWAVPLHYNGPAMLRGVAAADALAVIPPGGAKEGQEVEILDLPWSWSAGNPGATGSPGPNSAGNEGCFT